MLGKEYHPRPFDSSQHKEQFMHIWAVSVTNKYWLPLWSQLHTDEKYKIVAENEQSNSKKEKKNRRGE